MSRAALSSLLPVTVAIPLFAAVLAPLAARLWRQLPLIIGVTALLASGGLLAAMAPSVYGGHLLSHFLGHWYPVSGHSLGIAFAADSWGLTFALVTAFLGALLILYTMSELSGLGRREARRIHLPLPLAVRGPDRFSSHR